MEELFGSLRETLGPLLDLLLMGITRFVGALALLLIGWLIARIVTRILGKILDRVGINKLADHLNKISTLEKANIRIDLVNIVKRFVYWLLMLVFIISAVEIMGLTMVSAQLMQLINYLPQVFTAFLILAGGFYLADQVRGLVANAAKSMGISAWKGLSALVFYTLLIFIVIAALERLDFIDTAIITDNLSIILGGIVVAFAIGYGFAARPILSSLLASYYSRGNFEIGQEIEVDGHRGVISQMTNIALTLDTGDKQLIIPISRLVTDQVILHNPPSNS